MWWNRTMAKRRNHERNGMDREEKEIRSFAASAWPVYINFTIYSLVFYRRCECGHGASLCWFVLIFLFFSFRTFNKWSVGPVCNRICVNSLNEYSYIFFICWPTRTRPLKFKNQIWKKEKPKRMMLKRETRKFENLPVRTLGLRQWPSADGCVTASTEIGTNVLAITDWANAFVDNHDSDSWNWALGK